jgi:tripartite-type tricarboxylate transporter receptor subunit TctC
VTIWRALYAPKGTPKPAIGKLVAALQSFVKSEIEKWGPSIKKAGQYTD